VGGGEIGKWLLSYQLGNGNCKAELVVEREPGYLNFA
jgi:hypothetical protein